MLKYFKLSEFDDPTAPGTGELMQPDLLVVLDQLREMANVPITINSGYRTPQHNAYVGGSDTSSHLSGWAADIAPPKSYSKKHKAVWFSKVLQTIGKQNIIDRVGKADTFIHVDIDPKKQPAQWGYE